MLNEYEIVSKFELEKVSRGSSIKNYLVDESVAWIIESDSSSSDTVIEVEEVLGHVGRADHICPKFEKCSAPICPLDPSWRECAHLKGEPVCYFLRLHAKNALEGQKHGSVLTQVVDRVIEVYPKIIDHYAPLKTALKRASKTGQRPCARRSS